MLPTGQTLYRSHLQLIINEIVRKKESYLLFTCYCDNVSSPGQSPGQHTDTTDTAPCDPLVNLSEVLVYYDNISKQSLNILCNMQLDKVCYMIFLDSII